MRRQPTVALGHPMAPMDGTLVQIYSTIDAWNVTSHQPTAEELQTQSNLFLQLSLLPRQVQMIISVNQSYTL